MKFTWNTFRKVVAARHLIGRCLEVGFPSLGIENLTAKVDTGAYSGALHATKMKEVKTKDGKTSLQFSPLGSDTHTLETDVYHKRKVRSSNGAISQRYAIDTEIEILGRLYPITLTLTDRSSMKHEMLIGRKFLRTHGFLVDVSQDYR